MAGAAFSNCRSNAKRKAATSSKVCLLSYVGRLDDLTEKPQPPDGAGVGSAEPRMPNKREVISEEPRMPNGPRGGWEVIWRRSSM